MSKKYKSFTTKANNEEHCLYGFIKADNKITKNKKMNPQIKIFYLSY